jgi:hypothetical protein
MSKILPIVLLPFGLLFSMSRFALAGDDPYLQYVRRAPEFRPVAQDPAVMIGRWDTWIYMPWRHQWTIGTGDEGGRFCRDYGFNGGFTDHGEGPLEWLQKWQLRFYNDHTASKGYLYLRGANRQGNFQKHQRDPRAIRCGTDGLQPIDDAMLQRLGKIIPVEIEFPADVAGVVDKRSARSLGSGRRFSFSLHTTQAVFFSFRGEPPSPE